MTGVVSINHYTWLLALQQYVWFFCFYSRTVRLTNCSLIQRSVSFQGNMMVSGHNKCNRWYFKFNGNECSGPMTIEAAVFNYWFSGNAHLLHHRSFEGYCENITPGAVRVELWVGKCSDRTLGDAYTGWGLVHRIMIEEVSRPQS